MPTGPDPSGLPLSDIRLPDGFRISVFAYPVPNARALALGPRGTLFVGSRTANRVYAARDADGDGRAEAVVVLAEGVAQPAGVDVHEGDLYFSAVTELWRIDDVEQNLVASAPRELVAGDLPAGDSHEWKFIRFGPDGALYVPVGAPCNACDAGDPFAALLRMKPDASARELIARGIRNTVGFDWHPVTRELWFTDNGRDLLSDDEPEDELNRIPAGLGSIPHFGFPYVHADGLPDPDLGGAGPGGYAPPAELLGPHVAALGMRFYTGSSFPAEYAGDAFIAEHGSWNRTVPLGARVTRVRVADDGTSAAGYEVFAEGWQRADGSRWGRPADVLVAPDGSLLVSDDLAGAVYRISYEAGGRSAASP
ncbi:MAG: PQQ-dependent sugar dehydrogenase [Thermodesulfobacteriota bacterium]